jgi:hypothetical protein
MSNFVFDDSNVGVFFVSHYSYEAGTVAATQVNLMFTRLN